MLLIQGNKLIHPAVNTKDKGDCFYYIEALFPHEGHTQLIQELLF